MTTSRITRFSFSAPVYIEIVAVRSPPVTFSSTETGILKSPEPEALLRATQSLSVVAFQVPFVTTETINSPPAAVNVLSAGVTTKSALLALWYTLISLRAITPLDSVMIETIAVLSTPELFSDTFISNAPSPVPLSLETVHQDEDEVTFHSLLQATVIPFESAFFVKLTASSDIVRIVPLDD